MRLPACLQALAPPWLMWWQVPRPCLRGRAHPCRRHHRAGAGRGQDPHRPALDAIKVAQNLLWQNLPPAHNLTDAATVMRFRELVRSQAIRSALERSSDTLLAFTLRAVEREISDQPRDHKVALGRPRRPASEPSLGAPTIPHDQALTGGPRPGRTMRKLRHIPPAGTCSSGQFSPVTCLLIPNNQQPKTSEATETY